MMVPVPKSGEIYVRFGAEGATQCQTPRRPAESDARGALPQNVEERVRKALRQELREQGRADTSKALSNADIKRLIQRTVRTAMRRQETAQARRDQDAQSKRIQRLQNQVDKLQRQLDEQRSEARREASSRDASPQESVAAPSDGQVPFYRSTLGRPLTYLVPITGFRVGEGKDQFQIGVRGDYRSTASSRLHFVPELSFGVGGGQVSPTILFNGAYSFLRGTTTDLAGLPLEPYVGAGVGIASLGGFIFETVTNVMVGLDYRFQNNQLIFLEYSTFDLFDTHRIHLGVRVRF